MDEWRKEGYELYTKVTNPHSGFTIMKLAALFFRGKELQSFLD